MKALIVNEVVVQVEEQDFPVAPPFRWVDCPDDCVPGWTFYNQDLQPPVIPELTPEERQAQYTDAMQNVIDATAQSKAYANGYACASYASSTIEAWATEASTFIVWRDACWQYAYQVLSDVEGGGQAPSLDDFIANIPAINW